MFSADLGRTLGSTERLQDHLSLELGTEVPSRTHSHSFFDSLPCLVPLSKFWGALHYYGNGKYDLKGGWGNKGTNIIMPLSPRHLLFTQIGDASPERFTLTPKQTKQFQRFIAERSMRWIFANKPLGIVSKLRPRHINHEAF